MVCFGNRPLDWEDLLIGKMAGVGSLCQPIPLFSFCTWLSISLFLEASGTAPSQFSPFNALYAHFTSVGSHGMYFYSLISFWGMGVCLIFLIERKPAPCGNRILQFFSFFPPQHFPLILCGLESTEEGLFPVLLWRMVTVRWSFHFAEILAKLLEFSAPHFINIKNNHNDAFSNVLWKLMDN